jgi:hypothetical protein
VELAEVVFRLEKIEYQDGDELIIAWNSADSIPQVQSTAPLRVLPAVAEAGSYYARNVAVRASHNSRLLFIDGDCWPAADILGAYFGSGEHGDAGIIAGKIDAVPAETAVERYAVSREHLNQEKTLAARPLAYGQTANLLVARSVWDAVGGFTEGINSAGDADFCWRAQYAGVSLGYEPAAVVLHRHRRSIRDLWEQHVKYGRGWRWSVARYPGATETGPPISATLRAGGRLLATVARGRPERIRFAFLDVVSWTGLCVGWFRSNAAPVIRPPESTG